MLDTFLKVCLQYSGRNSMMIYYWKNLLGLRAEKGCFSNTYHINDTENS